MPSETANVVDASQALFTSRSVEWYSPRSVIERAVRTLGRIDLDPCSNSRHTPAVPAERHFTVEDNGLLRPWHGRVYMNPPYGRDVDRWVRRLCDFHRSGDVPAAVALLHARTDTRWFDRLAEHAKCFVRGRLTFSGAAHAAPFPSVVVYLGPDIRRFSDAFSDMGRIHLPMHRCREAGNL